MKKIVQVIGNLRGGGAEKVCLVLHKAFQILGHQSYIYLIDNHKIDYEDDHSIEVYNKNEIVEKIIEKKYDLIIGHMANIAEILAPIKGKKNVFFIVHTTYYQRLKNSFIWNKTRKIYLLRKIYKDSNMIFVSQGSKQDSLAKLKLKPKSVQVIYNPFDIDLIQNMGEIPLSLDYKYIVNIGSLNKIKRQDILIQAFSKLDTKLHLVILGKGRLEKKILKLVKKLGLDNRVHLLGWKSNPYQYIKNAQLTVVSSDVEGFGNVIVESLILGTSVVSRDCISGPNEILVDELKYYLVSLDKKSDGLKEKIKMALDDYPTIEKKYFEEFHYLKIAKKFVDLVEK